MIRVLAAVVAGLVLGCADARARAFTIDDALSIRTVSSPRISPDGRWVAYVETRNDLEKDAKADQIFIVSRDGAQTIKMTGDTYSASSPRWSSDGAYLSFLAARTDLAADAKPQVWTLNLNGGDAERFTNVPQGVEGYEWAPAGENMLLVIRDETDAEKAARENGGKESPQPWVIDRRQFKQDGVGYLGRARAHLYLLDKRDGAAVQITFGDYEDAEPVWRPDGAEIAFVSNRTRDPDNNDNTDIFVVSTAAGAKKHTARRLTDNEGPDRAPTWSADGKAIAYISAIEPALIWYATNHLAIVDSDGGEPRLITRSLDRNIDAPRFAPSGEAVIATIEDNAEQKLAEISIATGDVRPLIGAENTVFEFDVGASGVIAAPVSRPDLPGEIFVFEDGALKQASHVNDVALKDIRFAAPLNVNFASADGTRIQGFIYPPAGGRKKAPAFLFIHGGPNGQYDHSFDATAQLFSANGYAVIMPNPRGSSGWGQDFCKAIFADWGNRDFDDVMAAVDDAITRGVADEKRLVVGGWSYGGILTDHIITKTDRFKAAISGAGEAIYIGNYGHDVYQREWEAELGLPWEKRDVWERITPFYDLPKVTTPTLVIGGKEDWNVPIINSEQLYQGLKRLGVPTELVVYPDEDHSIDRPSFIRDRYQRYLDWYRRFLK